MGQRGEAGQTDMNWRPLWQKHTPQKLHAQLPRFGCESSSAMSQLRLPKRTRVPLDRIAALPGRMRKLMSLLRSIEHASDSFLAGARKEVDNLEHLHVSTPLPAQVSLTVSVRVSPTWRGDAKECCSAPSHLGLGTYSAYSANRLSSVVGRCRGPCLCAKPA